VRSSIVNTALRNSFTDFVPSAYSVDTHDNTSATYTHNTNTSTSNANTANTTHNTTTRTNTYASMSDSELDHSNRRNSSAVSFIRQKVISSGFSPVTVHNRDRSMSGGIGGTNSASVGTSSNANVRVEPNRGVAETHYSNPTSSVVHTNSSSNSAPHSPPRGRADSNLSLQSGSTAGKTQFNRLQALYERVTNKTT
jgi:hypothetical protein